MAKSNTLITKKRRGPAPTGVGTLIGVRLQPRLLAALDKFIEEDGAKLSRPEAVRMLLANSLTGIVILDSPETNPAAPAARSVAKQKAR